MKIGLVDVDGHAKKKMWGATVYPNLALCKLSAWHKLQGDDVEWVDPLFGEYDIVYISKIFNFTPDYREPIKAKKIVKGGTGYDVHSCLPEEVDRIYPDYSIYPNLPPDTAYGFLTRGCPNKCSWCVVPKKEGAIRPYMDIDEVANGRKNIVLMDNNIIAAGDYAKEQLNKIIRGGYKVDFNQALDARLMTEEFAELFAKCKWINRTIRFGCDTPKQIEYCERAIEMLIKYGFKGVVFLYCMLTNDFTESYDRIMYWHHKNREYRATKVGRPVYPHAQPYKDPYNPAYLSPQWQRDMARWVNNKCLFQAMDFNQYQPRKGVICQTYINELYDYSRGTQNNNSGLRWRTTV